MCCDSSVHDNQQGLGIEAELLTEQLNSVLVHYTTWVYWTDPLSPVSDCGDLDAERLRFSRKGFTSSWINPHQTVSFVSVPFHIIAVGLSWSWDEKIPVTFAKDHKVCSNWDYFFIWCDGTFGTACQEISFCFMLLFGHKVRVGAEIAVMDWNYDTY